jgi:hypothetical protein
MYTNRQIRWTYHLEGLPLLQGLGRPSSALDPVLKTAKHAIKEH